MVLKELNFYVYNQSFTLVAIVDKYISLTWADRFSECGDFELTIPYEAKWKSVFVKDYLCRIDFSDHWCFIEKIEISKDEESAALMTISGRSIESILERRIVDGKIEFGTDENEVNVHNSIKTLIYDNIISPTDSKRKISNFIFTESTDTSITKLKFAESYEGDDLLGVISGICADKHIGFRVLVNSSNKFVFSLYASKDRSKSSSGADYVIFSPYYDNVTNTKYFSSIEEYRNVIVISENDERYITVWNTNEEPTGLFRREVFESDSEMKDVELVDNENEYYLQKTTNSINQIKSKAKKKLNRDYRIKTGFEGDIVPEKMYKYRTHYNVGDKVQFQDSYGNSERVWISEVVITMDENGLLILPTFEEIDWE